MAACAMLNPPTRIEFLALDWIMRLFEKIRYVVVKVNGITWNGISILAPAAQGSSEQRLCCRSTCLQ